ncbi:hypothetical protein EDD29_8822 [Actinocorallia herbida]|uniref:DUF1449 family protein n=1 Tax=Actinocorallia herbida TaxID=58109 RepID=A0A3N1DC27_9ACTN|nr:hypothetical protein [Actinocorallia herbida]ROO91075.1 hypothetical protein EDD29_8822 [Actinocorallia herbida]
MKEFAEIALGMPTVVFTVLLGIVVLYWVLAIAGLDALADDTDLLGALGLRGIPTSVIISLFVAVAWFLCLAGTSWLGPNPLVVVGALAGGWLAARLLLNPLRYVLPESPVPSRHDFVGRLCVVRTGTVTERFGQAEVRAEDGSTALVQVRRVGSEPLGAGDAALIFDYDAAGEYFWVMPYDAALDPHRKDV